MQTGNDGSVGDDNGRTIEFQNLAGVQRHLGPGRVLEQKPDDDVATGVLHQQRDQLDKTGDASTESISPL